MTVKVRIAPSPTGYMHVGTAQSALFNWLFARSLGGQFIVRIEDTDRERSKPEYESSIIAGLKWLGLDWDNTTIVHQSERTLVYRAKLEQLLESGKAYWRQYSDDERAVLEKEGRASRERVIALVPQDNPEREIVFNDSIRGPVSVLAKHVGQLVIAKSLDEPLYHFAVVVDDIDMQITHVLRGEDHISNTPKHVLIYEALGATPPQFAHLPLMLAANRSKLSKRNGLVGVAEYEKDYLPDAMINFLGALSYTFEPELLSRDQMIKQFDVSKVHKTGAVFNIKKLNWYNAQYIRMMSPSAFKVLIGMPLLSDVAVGVITERLERLTDISQFAYLWETPSCDANMLCWKESSRADTYRALDLVRGLGELTQTSLDALAVSDFDGQKGSVYWPLRVALSGQRNSAPPLDIARAIGAEETRERITHALACLHS